MTLFEHEGYLSDELMKIEAVIVKKHQELFNLVYDLNKYTRKHVEKYSANSENGQQVISVSMFIKVLNTFQSLVILSRKGMVHEARILLRTLFEATVVLKLLCSDDSFYSAYAQSDLIYRRRLLKGARDNPDNFFESARELIKQGELEKIEAEIAKFGIAEANIKDRAKKAKMSVYYDSVYRIACDTCHAGPRSLEDYVGQNKEGEIVRFASGPFMQVDLELITAMGFVMIAMESLNGLFKVEHAESYKELGDKFIELNKNSAS